MPAAFSKGVIAPCLTPFNADFSVDVGRFTETSLRLLEDGCVALAPFGTTGEALSLGLDERRRLLEALVEAGAPPNRLLPGTGLCSLPDTVALSRHAAELGCAGVMTLPPFYFKSVSEEGLFAYYAGLIDKIGHDALRVYLYHIPQIAGVGLPVPLVKRLFDAFPDQVVGVKDSSGDWENAKALMQIKGLTVYPASEARLREALDLGAGGSISATANLQAGRLAALVAAHDSADEASASALQAEAAAFRLAMQKYPFIEGQKAYLAATTGDAGWARVRPPLVAWTVERGAALRDEVADLAP